MERMGKREKAARADGVAAMEAILEKLDKRKRMQEQISEQRKRKVRRIVRQSVAAAEKVMTRIADRVPASKPKPVPTKGKALRQYERERQLAKALVGDPLLLLPENRHLASDKLRLEREQKEAEDRRRKKLGLPRLPPTPQEDLVQVRVFDPDRNFVKTKRRGFSITSLMGCQEHHFRAAERFEDDWNTAYARASGAGPWLEKVEGGGQNPHLVHLARLDVQAKLRDLFHALGERDWALLEAALIFGFGPVKIHDAGGPEPRVVSESIKAALDKVAAFYDIRRKRGGDRLMGAIVRLFNEVTAEAEREAALYPPVRSA